jgi:hypothetical protein
MVTAAEINGLREKGFEVYLPRDSNDSEKKALGFKVYSRRPMRLWMKTIGIAEATLYVKISGNERLAAELGYYLIYDPQRLRDGYTQYNGIASLKFWPVSPAAYYKTYSPFPVSFPYAYGEIGTDTQFSFVERDLVMAGGFSPVFKSVGVWAKEVVSPTVIVGLEHEGTFNEVPIGNMLALGVDGEPYHMSETEFKRLYRA